MYLRLIKHHSINAYSRIDVQLFSFLVSAICRLHSPATLPHRRRSSHVAFTEEVGWAPSRYGHSDENKYLSLCLISVPNNEGLSAPLWRLFTSSEEIVFRAACLHHAISQILHAWLHPSYQQHFLRRRFRGKSDQGTVPFTYPQKAKTDLE